ATLNNIINLHGKVFSEEDGKKQANEVHKKQAKGASKGEHAKEDGPEDEGDPEEKAQKAMEQSFKEHLASLNNNMVVLLTIVESPNALNLYVKSCQPVCRSNQDASNFLGQLEGLDGDNHQTKRNQALNAEAKKQEEIDDENLNHKFCDDDSTSESKR
ncbi:MAG: hypothetical protein Q9226_009437, partial [Calogaya cf. arnoldii]